MAGETGIFAGQPPDARGSSGGALLHETPRTGVPRARRVIDPGRSRLTLIARSQSVYFRPVTLFEESDRCRWCGRQVAQQPGRGRPRLYCRQACRQRAYEARRRQIEGALRADEIPVAQSAFRALQDELYQLTAALEDVEQDLAGKPKAADYKAAFEHLYKAANRLRDLEIEPSS